MSAAGHSQRGFIIVAVLWMIAALGLLAAIYTRFALATAVSASVHEDRLRANGLISAGVEMSAFQLIAYQASPAEQRPTKGAFSFRLGRVSVTVDYQSEAARIDLNVASREMIAGLFRTFGAEPETANSYADRIIGWRTPGAQTGDDPEVTAYRVAGIAYKPRQGPFQSTAETWLVLGIPPVLKERALPFLTVYSGQANVDAENAAPEVVASLPNMTPERLGNVLQLRMSPPASGQTQSSDARATASLAANAASRSFRINIRTALENGRRVTAEVVILIPEDGDEPYRVLSWRDDFDGAS
jgi:general secretion pathway protein K